jgi:hypothetical protein
MERLDPSISRDYHPVVLHSDDLTEIVEILQEAGELPEISTTEYRFNSVAEVCDKYQSGRLTLLSIKSRLPYVSLELTRSGSRLYVGSSRPEAAGLFWKIDAILRRSQRQATWIYTFSGSISIAVLFGLGITPAFVFHLAAGLAAIALSGCWMIWFYMVMARFHSLIILAPRSEIGGFFKRNKDQLVLGLITALLGLIVGVIGTLLSTHIGK